MDGGDMSRQRSLQSIGFIAGGAISGFVLGVSSAMTYIFSRILMNAPNSGPSITTTFNAAALNVTALIECFENKTPDCPLPVNAEVNLKNWAEPLVFAAAACATAGAVVGLSAHLIKTCCQRDNDQEHEERLPLYLRSRRPVS